MKEASSNLLGLFESDYNRRNHPCKRINHVRLYYLQGRRCATTRSCLYGLLYLNLYSWHTFLLFLGVGTILANHFGWRVTSRKPATSCLITPSFIFIFHSGFIRLNFYLTCCTQAVKASRSHNVSAKSSYVCIGPTKNIACWARQLTGFSISIQLASDHHNIAQLMSRDSLLEATQYVVEIASHVCH